MTQKDEQLDVKSDEGTEEQSLSPGSIDEKASTQQEKTPPGQGRTPITYRLIAGPKNRVPLEKEQRKKWSWTWKG